MASEIVMNEATRTIDGAVDVPANSPDERIFSEVYAELKQLAAARLAREAGYQTLQPTALVHEAWLRLGGGEGGRWEGRAHYFAAAAEAMRRILIERARRRASPKHGGDRARVDWTEDLEVGEWTDDRVLLIHDALEELQKEDAEKAKVVLMKFFGGLTNGEVAETLGVTERTVERSWAFSKAWLMRWMGKNS